MRKRISIFAAVIMAAVLAAGCTAPALEQPAQPQDQLGAAAPVAEEAKAAEEAEAEAPEAEAAETVEEAQTAEESVESAPEALTELPAYTLPAAETEEDPYKEAICRYIVEGFGKHYDPADVSIPCVQIVAEETDDPEDIRVIGSYWIFNYDLNGDTLECVSGGSYPGCMHLKQTADGYVVTSCDVAADGEDYADSMKEICGSWYEKAMEVVSDDVTREQVRTQTVAGYVLENELPITKYKDYGWDPVELFPQVTEEHEMTTKMEGCDTFTQIVDGLEKGQGYANANLGGTDVLLVSSGTYTYEEDFYAAIDAEIFFYNDGTPEYLGYVECGGTAYPLAVKDGILYVANGHSVKKMTVEDGKLVTAEEGGTLFEELEDAEVVEFSTVG